MKYLKITLLYDNRPQGSFTEDFDHIAGFIDSLKDSAAGDTYQIEVVEMSPEKFEGLPEFTGF